MFKSCENLIDIDLTNLNTSRMEDINSLFEDCKNLEKVNFFKTNLNKIREKKIYLMDVKIQQKQKIWIK